MGSPEDEEGRFDDEGPQHRVTLTKGYWLFDTPVTQALWEAVMGSNPSKFQSLDRPVEQVSWDETEEFLNKLNKRFDDLDLTLPTEAQWEYACRAGIELATYGGTMEIKGERNAPVLDEISWYGGNSGVDFDLDEGYDSSGWKETQYDHDKAGTRQVGLKQANPWGLYDMLGNVWEWCLDDMRDYKDTTETDPSGSLESKSRLCAAVPGATAPAMFALLRAFSTTATIGTAISVSGVPEFGGEQSRSGWGVAKRSARPKQNVLAEWLSLAHKVPQKKNLLQFRPHLLLFDLIAKNWNFRR